MSLVATIKPWLSNLPSWLQAQLPQKKSSTLSVLPWYENQIILTAVLLTVSVWLFQQYFNWRQHRRLLQKHMPSKVRQLVSEEAFEKARLYSLDKSYFGFVSSLMTAVDVTFLMYAVYKQVWDVSEELATKWLNGAGSEIKITAVYVILWTIWGQFVAIPFSLYSTFVLERKHGFNRQTAWVFWTDVVKGLLLGIVISIPAVSALIWIVRRFGDTFYVAAWLFVLALQMFLMLIFPTFIQPLFNKFDPLPPGTLYTKIEELARRLKFPLSKIFVMDGSKRSSHSNAYFFGFFTKRIVLFDTLINQSSEDEICAILAHELGHWKCWHTMQMFILGQIQMFSLFYGYSLFSKQSIIFDAFGFTQQSGAVPLVVGLMLVSLRAVKRGLPFLLFFLFLVWFILESFECNCWLLG